MYILAKLPMNMREFSVLKNINRMTIIKNHYLPKTEKPVVLKALTGFLIVFIN
jgi:hypothetical protein